MKGFTALAILAGVMLAYVAGCASDSPVPATTPATSPTVCGVPHTDGIAVTTWDESRGVPTCGVGVLIIAPLTDPDDEDAAR
jgi:hypothetical protein